MGLEDEQNDYYPWYEQSDLYQRDQALFNEWNTRVNERNEKLGIHFDQSYQDQVNAAAARINAFNEYQAAQAQEAEQDIQAKMWNVDLNQALATAKPEVNGLDAVGRISGIGQGDSLDFIANNPKFQAMADALTKSQSLGSEFNWNYNFNLEPQPKVDVIIGGYNKVAPSAVSVAGSDPLEFKFGYIQSNGTPFFYATKDVIVQGPSKAEAGNVAPNNGTIYKNTDFLLRANGLLPGQEKVENLTFINLGDGVYLEDKNGISTDVSLRQAVKVGIASGILPDPATMESDYKFIEGGFSIPLLKFAGIAGGFMMDKKGNVYAIVDASVGYGLGLPIPVTGSVGQGYFGNADKSDKEKYREALEGYSFGTTTGAGIQGNASIGTSGVISGEVSVTPGIGKTVGGRYAWHLFNIYD